MPTLQDMVLPNIPGLMAQGAADALKVREGQQIVRDNQQKLDAQQRAQQEQAAVQRVMQESGGDWEVALPRLRMVSPDLASKYEEHLTKERASRAAAMKAEIDNDRAMTERGLALLRAIPKGDQATYAALRGPLAQIAPDLAGFLPEQYDAAVIDQIQTLGETAKDVLARNEQSLDHLAKGEYHQAAAMAFSAAQDAEDWQEAAEGLAEMGVPRAVVQSFGAWAPDAPQRALQLGMTPDARADNALAREKFTEDTRQFGVTSGQRDRALNLDAAGLQLRRDEARKEPLVAITGPDGQPVLVPRSQAAGKRPAPGGSGSGGGRGVTSGDANRMADFDTSLDDLAALNEALSETAGATGTAAAVGAWLPNAVTEYTGIGSASKQRQGVIDRVKQVIGKTLEGGVLRKEDEYKYTKILPTISDPPAVAASKLQGLERAIRQRRQTQIEALADAGYDTSAYEQRTTARGTAPRGGASSGGKVRVSTPNGQTFEFPNQAAADAFKRKAGIR